MWLRQDGGLGDLTGCPELMPPAVSLDALMPSAAGPPPAPAADPVRRPSRFVRGARRPAADAPVSLPRT